jgi:LuxR family maltose regulon positive regulatory protein
VPPHHVARAQVSALLDQGTQRPLTLVSAGPGWGKTLATAAWASGGPLAGAVGWLSLEPSDNDPRTFWTGFLSAVRGAAAAPPSNPISQLAPGLGTNALALPLLRAGIEELPAPVVVVLDDFHVISDPSVLDGIDVLLRHPLPQLRLVVLTRTDPALPVHRLRMSGQLLEIRARDLAFDTVAAAALLDAAEVDTAPADVDLLVQRTEGWPAGLRLAALYLGNGDPTHTPASFAGDDGVVTDYLVGEVLASQPPGAEQFLLRTSIVERLDSGLAEALTEESHAQQQLEALERSNAFVVSLGPGRVWFRYHPLLREMLQHRLKVTAPGVVADLHRRAAHWFADHGRQIEAMRHAADAEDWQLLGRIFVTGAAMFTVSTDRGALERVLARIPAERVHDGPDLAACAAAGSFLAGRYDDMAAHLERARREVLALGSEVLPGTNVACLLISVAVLRARGDIAGLRACTSLALEELAGAAHALPGGQGYRAVALGNLGTALLWSGELDQAETCLLAGLEAAEGTHLDASRINMLAHLALASVARGRLRAGLQHATRAVDLVDARGWGPLAQASTAYLALSLVHLRRNDAVAAQKMLELGESAARPEPVARRAMMLGAARLEASLGRPHEARRQMALLAEDLAGDQPPELLADWRTLAEAEIGLSQPGPGRRSSSTPHERVPRPVTPALVICSARRLLARGLPHDADEVLAPLRDAPDHEVEVEAWLLTALAADRLHDDNRATEAISRATQMAAVEDVRRPFVELEHAQVTRLLDRVRKVSLDAGPFVDLLLQELQEQHDGAGVVALAEPLTGRELTIVRLLPTMMTNVEIAAELFVSVNTVKSHLKHIYDKLDVVGRRDAVRRARDLGLLIDGTGPESDGPTPPGPARTPVD